MLRYFFLALLFFVFLFVFSPPLVEESRFDLNPNLFPENFWAGDLVLIQPNKPLDFASLSDRPMLRTVSIGGESIFLGTHSLYASNEAKSSVLFFGFHRTSQKNWLGQSKTQLYWTSQPIEVLRRPLKHAHQLRISPELAQRLASRDPVQRMLERNKLWGRIALEEEIALEPECWAYPLREPIVTSLFGAPRTPPSGRAYYHSGLDLRARSPVPVFAARSGVVRLVDHMTMAGNLIVIDHGQGIHSKYFHLSQIFVEANQKVKIGEQIGLTGATGRVEAPHLHWEILWGGVHSSPHNVLHTWNSLEEQLSLKNCNTENLYSLRKLED
jgi:murein DD-endopeptidase MepM/ murein hydrolase activator NlpD